jgi:hypothetical protein
MEIGKLLPNGHTDFVIAMRHSFNHRAAESQANARLITAAPDLLAACKNLVSMVDVNVPADTPRPSPLIAIRAAIAKAEGAA